MKTALKVLGIIALMIWEVAFFVNFTTYDTTEQVMCIVLMVIPFPIVFLVVKVKKKRQKQDNVIYVQKKKNTENAKSDTGKVEGLHNFSIDVSIDAAEAPQEVLTGMKNSITQEQLDSYNRIVAESLQIMKNTSNMETFFNRYEVAMQYALILEQASKAGCDINLAHSIPMEIRREKDEMLGKTLIRMYDKERAQINELKTVKGKIARIDKLIARIKKYEEEFEFTETETYVNILQKLNQMKRNVDD